MMNRRIGILIVTLGVAPLTGQAQTVVARLTSAGAVADDPLRDRAITELDAFLQKYPNSKLRPNALFELGELLVRRADERFNEAQRSSAGESGNAADSVARADSPIRPDYSEAIRRYEELVRRFPAFDRIDAAAYTLGTLYSFEQRYAESARMFETVTQKVDSRFRAEALFRLGDANFELASKERGPARKALFAKAATAYEQSTAIAPKEGDIYFLSLYKLGWSYYNQASQTGQDEYNQAVNVFGRLVEAYDKLSPEQQARLGLRSEAIEYMAIAFTQVGGSEAANAYFAAHGGTPYRLTVLQRVAASLRDQGDFPKAIIAYRALLAEMPNDSSALIAAREIVDIYQNRMIEPDSAQVARLELVERFGPGSAWAQANAGMVAEASKAREEALRQSAQYVLAAAQKSNNREAYGRAADLYKRYVAEFANADSAKVASLYYAEALFGQGNYSEAGAQYSRAAYDYNDTSKVAFDAGRSAIVAFDSALARAKTDRTAQDALFASIDKFASTYPQNDLAKKALIQKGRRASETQRWEVMSETFKTYVQRYPNDPYTPTAQRLIADATFKSGNYAEAQAQWETAEQVARSAGRRALADSIALTRRTAADAFADTLIKQGEYGRAAEEVYVAFADKNPQSDKAPEALKNAIETYLDADSVAKSRNDENSRRTFRQKAVELSNRLVAQYPNYKYRLQYQTLAANLQADLGNREEAAASLQKLIADNPNAPGRSNLMLRLAVTLDSAGKKQEAAAAYEQFATAYPRDTLAAGALRNAALTYEEANNTEAAARVYGVIAARSAGRAAGDSASARRIVLLQQLGDSATAAREFARLCDRRGTESTMRDACAGREAERKTARAAALFNAAIEPWAEYQSLKFSFTSKAQITAAGVQRAQADKQRIGKRMTALLKNVIATGDAKYASAATYYLGMSEWEYGNFLKNVQLPDGLTDDERKSIETRVADLAQPRYDAAQTVWKQLVDKATADSIDNEWVTRAKEALEGNVPDTPPTSSVRRGGTVVEVSN